MYNKEGELKFEGTGVPLSSSKAIVLREALYFQPACWLNSPYNFI